MSTETSNTPWTSGRLLFRFLLIYFVLYAFPFPFTLIPGLGDRGFILAIRVWDPLVLFVGEQVLGLGEITARPAGSGDTTWNYVQLLVLFVLATIGALLWSIADRHGAPEERFARPLRVGCRYYLAAAMLNYGSVKILPSQFPFPALDRLLMPLGDASPMGLAWRFMGYSTAYNVFAGLGEVIGGLLLLWRRTTTLGALILIAVLSNVVMINFAFDVPVKLYSSHLLVVALALFSRDARRLLDLLIFHRAVAPRSLAPYFARTRARRGVVAAKILVVGTLLATTISGAAANYRSWGGGRPLPPLHGIWDVQTFVRDGETVPPLITESQRPRTLVFDFEGVASLWLMDGTRRVYQLEIDEAGGTMTLSDRGENQPEVELHYDEPTDGRLDLVGQWGPSAISIELERRDHEAMELIQRGFHWVNETPYHR